MKKTAAKKTKSVKRNVPAPSIAAPSEPKSVSITMADNGLTVRQWGPKGETLMIAKTANEALRHAKELLGAK